MNEQIRKIREEIAKEFDQKYQASLLEVDLYKEQLENNLKETEKRHQQLFQRQAADKDKLIQQINGHKQELESEISHLERFVAEKEELVQNQKETIDQLKSELGESKIKEQESSLMQEVVNSYLEATKRQYEEMRAKLETTTEALNDLKK